MNIIASHISFSYPRCAPVLHDISIKCTSGTITALIGSNGTGKSTLMKILAGLLPPTTGQVTLDSQVLSTLSPLERARRIGLLLQALPPPFDFSVQDFVILGRTPRLPRFSAPTDSDWQAVNEALTLLELAPLARKSVRHLSGGEFQRARFASLLALQSDVLLLDEPTSAQDPHFTRLISELLLQKKQQGKAILVISHDLPWLESFADYAVMLKDASIFAEGIPNHIFTADNLKKIF